MVRMVLKVVMRWMIDFELFEWWISYRWKDGRSDSRVAFTTENLPSNTNGRYFDNSIGHHQNIFQV